MELIKFLKDNREYFNLRAIEKKCGIPDRTLKGVVGGRNLAEKHCESLISFFKRFDVVLEYVCVDGRSPTHGYEPLTKDWVKTVSGKYRNVVTGRKEYASVIGGKTYVPLS